MKKYLKLVVDLLTEIRLYHEVLPTRKPVHLQSGLTLTDRQFTIGVKKLHWPKKYSKIRHFGKNVTIMFPDKK